MSSVLQKYINQYAGILYLKITKEGKIQHANRFAEKILGQDITGKNLMNIFLGFQQQIDIEKLPESDQEVMLNINTSNEIPETFYFRFFRQADHIDVLAESKKEEIERLRTELLDINNELSNASRELHKKNAELKKLNELKNHFLNAAAHDLRNPMGNIIRLSEFLLEELKQKLNKQQLQFLSLIKSLSSFGLDLLNDLLDMARIESGKLVLNKKQINLLELIKQVIKLNQFASERKNILIKMDVFEKIEEIEVDESSLKQVMDNLLNNAIKFSPPETTITIGLLADKENVTVFIKDQGSGISDEQMKKLFIPFSNAKTEGGSGAKGSGLGLAIVEKIITAHNGKIWVKSDQQQGTTIYFSLPVMSNQANLQNNG